MESGEGEREGGRKDRIRERVRIFKYYKTVGNRETKGDRAFVCLYKHTMIPKWVRCQSSE